MSAPEISVAPHIGNSGVHRTKRNSDPSETLACFLINSCPTSTITSRKLFTAIYGYTRIESQVTPLHNSQTLTNPSRSAHQSNSPKWSASPSSTTAWYVSLTLLSMFTPRDIEEYETNVWC